MACTIDVECYRTAGPVPEPGRTPLHGGTTGPGGRIPVPRLDRDDDGHRPGSARPHALNPRDREVLRHLAAGRSTAQIAAALSVSANTARTRIRRVSAKLAVTGRVEVVGAARSLGLV